MVQSVRGRMLATSMMGGLAIAAAMAVQPAFAQDEVAIEEIVVTGSRIRRVETETSAPVSVVTEQTLTDRGVVQVGDMLNQISSNVPSFAIADGTGNEAGSGQTFPNLFGLGAGRTLTLVNGRRMVTTSQSRAVSGVDGLGDRVVDTNIIPTGLIERIDVVQAGGAAVYGSDAIAGVVNYVLKDSFEGLELDAQYGISSRDDYPTQALRATAGKNFLDGRANIAANLEWSKTDSLLDYDRPRTNLGRVTVSNPANRTPTDGIPSLVENLNTRFVTFNANGVISRAGPPFASQIGAVAGQPIQSNATGDAFIPYNVGTLVNPNVPPFTSGGDGLPYQELAALQVGIERWVGNVVGHVDLTDRIRLSGEFMYAKVEGRDPYGQQASNTVLNNAASGAGAISLSRTNPFLTPAMSAALGAGGPPLFVSKFWTDLLPTRENVSTTNTARAVVSLDGDFDFAERNFYWSLSASRAETDGESTGWGVITSRFNKAVNAVRNSSGAIVCAVNANATTADDDAACTPLNPFGVGNVTQANRLYLTAPIGQDYLNTQDDYLATIGGDIFNLPAGAVKFSAAYEHRREEAKYTPFVANQQGIVGSQVASAATKAAYNTDEFSGELLVPIFGGDFTLPGVRSLEFDGAYRRVKHSIAGSENIWGAGLRWEVFEGLTIRGSRSRNFRAPTLDQLAAPSRTDLSNAGWDPCDADRINSGPNPAIRLANCQALFAANPSFGPLATFQNPSENFSNTLVTSGGNPNLRNELSDTRTIGFIYQPTFVPGLTIVVDRIDVDLTDGLSPFTPQDFMAACYDSSSPSAEICGTFTRDPTGAIATAMSTTFNAGTVAFRGETYNVNYRFPIGRFFNDADYGDLELAVDATHTTRYEQSVTGFDVNRYDGTTRQPDWVVDFDATYSRGPLRLYYSMHYLPEAKINSFDTIESTPTPEIKENYRHNISAQYNFGKYTVRGGVINLTDEQPSFPTRNYGDILGRRYYVGLNARF
ncbi:TonB-dependent receptor [Phenylobacterium sp. Root77]|jgi:iron complex outermembrane receptor protein|uniref:TonB-dependent receptor domain-containing protein n=1 Tax=unclassified Phenylobacterium TaxID=2640670 RepID=UPI0006F47757|nr:MULTISPECIES: TonB-dependent receptor [unclassified Phenylobacterium]KQW68143.1 TonB-dependent receptor [Phenylobacterium sp. Root1277]KQW91886.1 TonB-dependent receptor [Phenylobacterium sp. Root1290]KRC40117.1 TonB-dependent receptor [Phenylobacterium sp. Root77]